MSDTLRDRVVASLGDAYDIEGELGRGGMGVVYRATDRKLRRTVAVKVLPPELAYRDDVRQRFLREAQTAAQLNHPHIVPIYAVEERDGLVCFVMALVEGESVGARIARERWLPVGDVSSVLGGVADALAYAHSRGIVHRDIKPDNILVDRQTGRAMVTDFGIARAAEGDTRLTVTGIAVGTPAYMSPEQAMGEREIDGRSDVYSLAVVGYQMLCGETPFRATNTPSMLMKHISETPPPLHERRPDLPAGIVAAIERAMAKKPSDRWPGAGEFRDAIRAATIAGAAALPPARAADSRASAEASLAPIPELPSLSPPPGRAALPPAPTPERLSASWKRPAAATRPEGEGTGLDGRVREILNPTGRDRGRPRGGIEPMADPREAAKAMARDARDMARDAREMARDARSAARGLGRDARATARDAIDAANAGWGPGGSGLPAPIPPWMPASWRDARRNARAVERDQARALAGRESLSVFGRLSIPERIRAFRRRTASTAVTVGMLGTINLFTGDFPWALFPAFFMGLALIQRGASLWADGVRWGDVFGKGAAEKLKEAELAATSGALMSGVPSSEDYARKLAPDDVLAGPHGAQVLRAASDRMAIHEVIGKLTKADTELIPDVAPTVDALAERVGSVAQSLHRLDEDVQPEVIEGLKGRIAAVKAQPESREREQKLQLLERQLATMTDLLSRRDTLVAQLESASLMLQNMRLDMIALRSAGVQSAIDDVSSATQEARALSRDIAHVLEAAREVR